MFRDRAEQFKDRLGWDVNVDQHGLEKDQYDVLDPVYAVYEMPDGTHGGSMRLMRTTERTMANEHFGMLNGGVHIASPLILESTRFCVSPKQRAASASIAAAVMAASCRFGAKVGATTGIGVMDVRMLRVYKRLGFEPDIVGTAQDPSGTVALTHWGVDQAHESICNKAGIDPKDTEAWVESSEFGRP